METEKGLVLFGDSCETASNDEIRLRVANHWFWRDRLKRHWTLGT